MTKTAEKKAPKPRDWSNFVEKFDEVGGGWIAVAEVADTSAAKKWIVDNEDAKDGDKFRTIIVTSQTTVRVETVTKRTFATASYDAKPEAKPEPAKGGAK